MASPDPAGLDRLHDLVGASPVPWWPPAPGWYVVAALTVVLAGWVAWHATARHRADRYRRRALAELEWLRNRVRNPDDRARALADLPEVLKRTALEVWPRERVAGLTGDDWATFLDETAPSPGFRRGTGRDLLDLAHRPPLPPDAIGDGQVDGWFALAEAWIRTHRRPGGAP